MGKENLVIWPWSVRLIHWMVAITVVLDIYFLEEGDPPHRYAGYLALVLVLIRFVQGFIGKDHVKFSNMPMSRSHVKAFFRDHFKRQSTYKGHNPLASIVYFLMWFSIIALAISGWMMGLDAFWGDETLEVIHTQISNFLLGLVVLHIVGVVLDALLYRRKTWMGMIKGYK